MSTLFINFENNLVIFADVLVALGGRRRLEIMKMISDGKDWTISDMARKMNCGIANLSQQVAELEKAGLVVKKLSKTVGNNTKVIKPTYKNINIRLW